MGNYLIMRIVYSIHDFISPKVHRNNNRLVFALSKIQSMLGGHGY